MNFFSTSWPEWEQRCKTLCKSHFSCGFSVRCYAFTSSARQSNRNQVVKPQSDILANGYTKCLHAVKLSPANCRINQRRLEVRSVLRALSCTQRICIPSTRKAYKCMTLRYPPSPLPSSLPSPQLPSSPHTQNAGAAVQELSYLQLTYRTATEQWLLRAAPAEPIRKVFTGGNGWESCGADCSQADRILLGKVGNTKADEVWHSWTYATIDYIDGQEL